MEKLNWSNSKKVLKKELESNFPGVKFSLRKHNYDTLDIDYVDTNINAQKVRDLTMKFEGKTFDGMIDLESYVNTGLAFGYIFINREITDKKYEEVYNNTLKNWSFDGCKLSMNYQEFIKLSFTGEYENLKSWGHDPYNMLYRIISRDRI